jgi:hypothetical protein
MCQICLSALLADLNKKINWRPDRVIKWAGRRGLKIDTDQLRLHFQKHLDSPLPKDIGLISTPADTPTAPKTDRAGNTKKTAVLTAKVMPNPVTDEEFLTRVIGDVYESLSAGQFELKLEYGFRAIELKQKIAESTNVENRLLELLNEIRTQELSASGGNPSRQ